MKKLTKKEIFNAITDKLNGKETTITLEDMLTCIAHEIELLDKKNTNKKPTKAQTENEKYKADIMATFAELADDAKLTVTEVLKTTPSLAGQSTQKVSALCKLLENDGKLIKITEKKVSYYQAAVEDTEEVEDTESTESAED